MRRFLAEYDLDTRDKYRTRACQWYRESLLRKVEGKHSEEDRPGYDEGRAEVKSDKKK